jgi:PBP1b-binding outer membrane lipoprotein LpoB
MTFETQVTTMRSVIVLVLLVVIAVLFMGGCASMEPASTDNHHTLPQVTCSQLKYNGSYHTYCCDNSGCFFTKD